MMTELSDLYQEVILDHNKRPRNYGRLVGSNRTAEGFNPLCGDHITVHLLFEDGVIRDVAFEGSGCAVSKASASMMTEALKGRTEAEARALFEGFHRLVTGRRDPSAEEVGARSGVAKDGAGRPGTPSGDAPRAGADPGGRPGPGQSARPVSASRNDAPGPSLGKLAVFSGVSEFPMRVKCATLAWHTLKAALEGRAEAVSTE
jgi:nitrogen fixation NifU-like protein